MMACPCCAFLTLPERASFDICPVCFWEDDGNDDPDGDQGPNGVTLRVARQNYQALGVSEARFKHLVREAQGDEISPDKCQQGFANPMLCPDMNTVVENRGWIESRQGYIALLKCEKCGRTCEGYVASPTPEAPSTSGGQK